MPLIVNATMKKITQLRICFNNSEEVIFNFIRPVTSSYQQPQILIVRKIIVHPVYKNLQLIFYTKYQHQMKTHPYHPGKPSAKM